MPGSTEVSYEFLLQPSQWMGTGDRLLESAQLLRSTFEPATSYDFHLLDEPSKVKFALNAAKHLNGFFLLTACAVENYLKALRLKIERSAGALPQADSLPTHLKTHNLVRLAKESGLALSTQEDELLSRLTKALIWSARYPVPLQSEAGMTERALNFDDWRTVMSIRRKARSAVFPDLDPDASLDGLQPADDCPDPASTRL